MINLQDIIQERESWWHRKDGQRFKNLIDSLPDLKTSFEIQDGKVKVGAEDDSNREAYISAAKEFIPWKKGPFNLCGEVIDAEWRSDMKWDRLAPHLGDLKGKSVLDIGCNNGYFLFRLAALGAAHAKGLDPVLPFAAQFQLIAKASGLKNISFDLLGIEHVEGWKEEWDLILHMGIIYHHRSPLHQLIAIREALKPGGQAIIETIGIPGEESYALFPEDRYARMGNVWFIPTLSCLLNWAKKAKFVDVKVLADSDLTSDEQRLTAWCPPPLQSLTDGLDPNDPTLTIEGHPAPRRFMISVTKKGGA